MHELFYLYNFFTCKRLKHIKNVNTYIYFLKNEYMFVKLEKSAVGVISQNASHLFKRVSRFDIKESNIIFKEYNKKTLLKFSIYFSFK